MVESPNYLVGIGASAGGLEALEEFFLNAPVGAGLSYVIIQHLSPDFRSLMDELLARKTKLPIYKVEEGMQVERDSIYLIPAGKEMTINGKSLHLVDRGARDGINRPIDIFFESLGKHYKDKAVAIVLSGTGTDSALGIKTVKSEGGLVLAQTPETAKFDGMPRAALATNCVDGHFAPAAMPAFLIEYMVNPGDSMTRLNGGGDPSLVSGDDLRSKVLGLFKEHYQVDFSCYKSPTILRRLQRRLTVTGINSLQEYYDRICEDDTELNNLYNDLLIGVTRFFRDAEAFSTLQNTVVHSLVKQRKAGEEIRVWVAGCASGQEAYSIAILFFQSAEKLGKSVKLKLFATDIHQGSLDHASTGVFTERDLEGVSPQIIERYFLRSQNGEYQIIESVRQSIIFSRHDLISDPPFTRIDLLSCRNLLIYLRGDTQQHIFSKFHFALRPDGFLFIGPSESIGEMETNFQQIDFRWKLYRKDATAKPPLRLRSPLESKEDYTAGIEARRRRLLGRAGESSIYRAYDALLNTIIKTGFLITADGRLLHCFGDASRYISYYEGRVTYEFLDAIPQNLKIVVATAVQKAKTEEVSVRYRNIKVDEHDGIFDIIAEPLGPGKGVVEFLLVTFENSEESESQVVKDLLYQEVGEISESRIQALETELKYTKENLQATIEELQTSNEEVQASNEELVASNEELQSTNEELHSVNEELYTVNSEHQNKIEELLQLTSDMNNLLASTEIGTIFLDDELRIRKYTPAVNRLFHLMIGDIGRPIEHFAHNLEIENLRKLLELVLEKGNAEEREVRDKNGSPFLLRVLPYYKDGKSGTDTNGIVLTFVDIRKVKEAQKSLEETTQELQLFSGAVAHDVRAPIRQLGQFIGFLQEDIQNGDVTTCMSHLKKMTQIIDGAKSLIERLLELSKIESSTPFVEEVDVRKLVEEVISVVNVTFHNTDIEFEISSLPIIRTSALALGQVFKNLFVNSVRFRHPERILKVVVTHRVEHNVHVFSVKDNGSGFPEDKIDELFHPFSRADDAVGSMGLGVAICRRVLCRLNGELWAYSPKGEGTEICFSLPFNMNEVD